MTTEAKERAAILQARFGSFEMEEEESPEQEAPENPENEDLRHMNLEQLATMEPSNVSDEDSYHVRLSCILEDDESESSGRTKEFPKNGAAPRKTAERDKSGSESDSSENLMTLRNGFERGQVQVTDLDEESPRSSDAESSPSEKTEIQTKTERETEEEEEEEEAAPGEAPYEIKKLKSTDNVPEKKLIPKRTEFSSDSSDIDISITTEKPVDAKVARPAEDEEVSEEPESWIFQKVSRSCVERVRSRGEEEPEGGASRVGSVEREILQSRVDDADPKMILQVVQLRSKSPRVYTPPVPPETYLWEELKRIRGKGGYPWTYLDKPPFDEAAWKKYMEHEYEPINPPPLTALRRKEEEQSRTPAETANDSGIPQTESRVPRAPREEEPVEPRKEVTTMEDMEVEGIAAAREAQDQMESRFLAQTPTTTASRTDADVNTSMLDSSGLEDIPLKRASRGKRSHGQGIQQKLRNHAGRIRNKFRSIPRPPLSTRERQKEGAAQDKPKFRLPERPKFSFPDKTKFTLPDRAKFKLPEKPKFTLPERPKFSLPERPRLNLPERPKLHLPEKLHFPDRTKFHLPERPKFTLPEMSKFHLPERPKLHLPERPRIHMPSFVKPLRERQEASPRKNIFELDFKSYPKIFSKSRHKREYTTSSPKKARGSTPPPKMRSDQPAAPERKKVPVGQRWIKKMNDIKFADEEASEVKDSRRSDHSDRSESFTDFRTHDLGGYMEDLDESRFPAGGRKTLSTKSSISHMSERDAESLGSSEGRLRKGVLEEIDSDQFFLRKKGISQEDIDMGKYLSHEIREAFKSPEVNALRRMDYYDEIDVENEPSRPARTRSLKKRCSLKKHFESDPVLSDSGYKTYPPRRPNRKSRSQSRSLVNEEATVAESGPMYENEPGACHGDNLSEYYKSPGPVKEYEHYKVPRPIGETTPVPHKRKKMGKKKLEDMSGMEASVEILNEFPPQPLTRKKSKKRLEGKQESFEGSAPREGDDENLDEHDYIIPVESESLPEETPIPPRRTRSLTRSLRSSRSLRSEEVDEFREVISVEPLADTQSLTQIDTARPHHYEMTEDDPGFGYATIGKPMVTRPSRQRKEKPQRPPAPRRKKDHMSVFNTVPRRTPVRPIRNYSTLGPSRPPRKGKMPSAERLSHRYIEFDADTPTRPEFEECHESNLQKEEVIEKMKGRPLPPPPRPPRQKSRGPEEFPTFPHESEKAKISVALLKGEVVPVEVEALVHAPPPEPEPVPRTSSSVPVEVCASTQTDPLPDDFLLDVEEDIIQEFSHEQLQIQQAFLEEMKKEAEARFESPEDKAVADRLERELLAELERETETQKKQQTPEQFDDDLGYASLDRKQRKQEPEPKRAQVQEPLAMSEPQPSTSAATLQPIHVPVIPDIQTSVSVLRTDKLDVKELEVERLNVRELQAQEINVSGVQGRQLTCDEVEARSGNLSLGNIQLPPNFIREIMEKIPWDELRPHPIRNQLEAPEEGPYIPPRRARRIRRASTSSEEEDRPHRPRHPGRTHTNSVVELSKQLATACAASGVRAMQCIASRIQNSQLQDKALLMRMILCVLAILVAGFLLLGVDRTTVLHHHWDFQFPPQPPPRQA